MARFKIQSNFIGLIILISILITSSLATLAEEKVGNDPPERPTTTGKMGPVGLLTFSNFILVIVASTVLLLLIIIIIVYCCYFNKDKLTYADLSPKEIQAGLTPSMVEDGITPSQVDPRFASDRNTKTIPNRNQRNQDRNQDTSLSPPPVVTPGYQVRISPRGSPGLGPAPNGHSPYGSPPNYAPVHPLSPHYLSPHYASPPLAPHYPSVSPFVSPGYGSPALPHGVVLPPQLRGVKPKRM